MTADDREHAGGTHHGEHLVRRHHVARDEVLVTVTEPGMGPLDQHLTRPRLIDLDLVDRPPVSDPVQDPGPTSHDNTSTLFEGDIRPHGYRSPMTRSTHAAIADERNANVQIYINGEFFHRSEARISVFDSGFLVGDGIWEGIRLHQGRLAFLDRHLDRLFSAARAVQIDIGTRADIEDALRRTVAQNDMHDGVHVRLMITRGDKSTPSQHPSNCVGGPNMVIIAEHKRADPSVTDHGISLFTATVRRPPPDTLDQRLNCHSKLHEVIALIQATNAGADEALMLDPTGAVATCNATNFFVVRDGHLWTSTGHYSLPGITRAVVLEVAEAAGVPTHQAPFSLTDVYAADEAFVTGTFGGLTPVSSVDGRVIGDVEGLGPVGTRLADLYRAAIDADVAIAG